MRSAGRAGSQRLVALAMAGLILASCSSAESPSALDTRGPAAGEIAALWWLLFWLGTAVFVVVLAVLLIALFRKRRDHGDFEPGPLDGTRVVVIGGIIIPLIILLVVFGFTLRTLAVLAAPDEEPAFSVEVIGNMWWWEVRYPAQQIVTANELHIPAGEPVRVVLTAKDVIHSFWVPELHGKLDLVPGRVNEFWIEADEPGVYRGLCAEYCGLQHANMQFLVVAEPPEAFDAWLEAQRRPAVASDDELVQRGQEVFLETGCIQCHTIRGTDATGNLGPDLTHLASRLTLGAATVENNLGYLGGWVANPHGIKPGVKMPPSDLSPDDLQALLAYLESLE